MRGEVTSLQSTVSNVHAPNHNRKGGFNREDDQAEWARQEQQVRNCRKSILSLVSRAFGTRVQLIVKPFGLYTVYPRPRPLREVTH
jgi:hypothetical protein